MAHEALISNWGTLRAWVNEDREFLLWRERLDALLKEWERTEENVDALLRGPLLIEAQKWFDQRIQDLSDQEQEFIAASRDLRERIAREERQRQEHALESTRKLAEIERQRADAEIKARRRQRNFFIVLIALLLFAGTIAAMVVWAYISSSNERDARHNWITSAQFSPDGQRVLTASADGAARLWDALTGESVGEPMRHTGQVTSVQFSPDGQRVLTIPEDGAVQLWDALTGKPVGEPMKHKNPVRSAQFGSDGQRVLTASTDGRRNALG